MFKSKTRPITYTQYEHGRLAGTLAGAWGNESFDRPALDFEAQFFGFVAGVTLHDWGYGVVDNLPIGEASEEAWLEVIRRGVEKRFEHPVTDIVVKLHLRRLLSWHSSAERETLMAEIDRRVEDRLPESNATLEEFQRADKITQLCDMISFSFCFEAPGKHTYEVYRRRDSAKTTNITYEIKPGGEVIVDPWPFSVPVITGVAYAFKRHGYPDTLDPLTVPYSIRKRPSGY